jgi:hypothetical protein
MGERGPHAYAGVVIGGMPMCREYLISLRRGLSPSLAFEDAIIAAQAAKVRDRFRL